MLENLSWIEICCNLRKPFHIVIPICKDMILIPGSVMHVDKWEIKPTLLRSLLPL